MLAHSPGQYLQDRGGWWVLYHASVTLSLFLGFQRKLIFQISGANVRVTKGEADGHQRPALGMNNHSEKGNGNNNESAQSSKKPVSWLQKFKHKSPATLDSLLSNKETNSALKKKTVKLKSKTPLPSPPPPQHALVHTERQMQLGEKQQLMSTEVLRLWLRKWNNTVFVLAEPISRVLPFIIPKQCEQALHTSLVMTWMIFRHTN